VVGVPRFDADVRTGHRATLARAPPLAASEAWWSGLGARGTRGRYQGSEISTTRAHTPRSCRAWARVGLSRDRSGERWGTVRYQKSAGSRAGEIGNGSGCSFKCSRILRMIAGSVIIAIM